MIIYKRFSLLFFGLCSLVFSGTGNAQTLVYCSEGAPDGFDPALYTSATTFDASSRQLYNKLVEFELGTTNVLPSLAESWEVSEDGLTYTFSLRAGVKFHTTEYFTPTRDFNADDVIFSFERQRLDDHPFNKASGGTWEYFGGMSMPELIKSVVKVDDLTVQFELHSPEAPMIANFGMDFASILSKEYADQLLESDNADTLSQLPVGTGPFKFVAYEKDVMVRYSAHEDYWASQPYLEQLQFLITPDPSVRYEKLKEGVCHVMSYPTFTDLEDVKTQEDLQAVEREGLNVGYLAFNTTLPPYDNALVRRALNMAVNKQAIVDTVFQGAGTVAKNPFPPTMWSYNHSTDIAAYNPPKAREILQEQGVNNLSMELWITPERRSFNPDPLSMAEAIQADLSKVNVDVEIVSYEWGEFLSKSKELDRPGAALLGWTGDNGDPDNFLTVLLGCDRVGRSNRAQWCYEPFNEVINKARVLTNIEERSRLYQQAQRLFNEQAPWIPIAHSVIHKLIRKEVKGFEIDPFGGSVFYGVKVE